VSRAWIAGQAGQQVALLPVDVSAWLPADHLVFTILAQVQRLDLSEFETAYRVDGRGRPPYHPRVMVALILYCRAKGLLSSRDVAAACYDDLGARLVTGNRYPDRSTIDRFLDVHAAAVKTLLPQTLRLGHAAGLVDVSVVAGDGTKIAANAAKQATVSEGDLLAQIADLEQALHAAQQQWAASVGAEGDDRPDQHPLPLPDGVDGRDLEGWDAVLPAACPAGAEAQWRKVQSLAGVLARRRQALDWLREHPNSDHTAWQQRLARDRQRVQTATEHLERTLATVQAAHDRRAQAAAEGRKPRGNIAVPASTEHDTRIQRARARLATATARAEATAANPPTGKVNTTDPTSAIMPSKHGGYDQNHNVQAIAAKDQLILAIGVHLNTTDTGALPTLVRQARTNLDAAGITTPIGVALFDSGYASEANFTTDLPITQLLVAVHPSGSHDPTTATIPTAWQPMADQLTDPDNGKRYQQRTAIIEPVFAHLFTRFARTLHTRNTGVETELHLWATTHNLLKIRSHQRRRRPDTS
jgi:transposase